MTQQVGKWVKNNTLNGDKIRLANDQFLRGRNAADTADINLLKVNSTNKAEFGVEPTYSGQPSGPTSLTNKQYVLDAMAGMRDLKDAVRLCSPTLLPAYTPSGTGIGKTLTADTNGALSIDGFAVLADDRIGITKEGIHNGIYIVTQVGDAGTPWILTRATDADNSPSGEISQGMSFDVVEGTVNGKSRWLLTTVTINIDVAALTFVKVPSLATLVNFVTEDKTISAADILAGYVDLANKAEVGSLLAYPVGGPVQQNGVDLTLSVVANVTRLTFAGDLLTNIAENDVLVVKYAVLT